MYFWNYKLLAQKLHHNQLTEKDKFKYLFVGMAITLGYMFILSQGYTADTLPDNLYLSSAWRFIIFCAVEFLILILFYHYNQKGDGKNFIERYIVLSFPIMIKTGIMMILTAFPVGIGLLVFLIKSHNFSFEEAVYISTLPTTLVAYLLSLYYHLDAVKIASGNKEYKAR